MVPLVLKVLRVYQVCQAPQDFKVHPVFQVQQEAQAQQVLRVHLVIQVLTE